MNKIREIQRLNDRELATVVPSNASWHTDYRDTAYIYIGGLALDLSEGDVITIFSQYGEPVWLRLMRDKETGKSKGFAWLKYEDQRSCDLAVDNLGGATVMGRLLAVDHTRYKKKEDEDEDEFYVGQDSKNSGAVPGESQDEEGEEIEEEARPLLKEELELAKLMRDHDDDDPMKSYMIEQKKEEVAEAKKKALVKTSDKKDRRHHRESRDDRDRGSHKSRHRCSRDGDDRDRRRDGDRSERYRSRRDRSVSPRRESRRDRSVSPRRDSRRDRSISPRRDSRRDRSISPRGDLRRNQSRDYRYRHSRPSRSPIDDKRRRDRRLSSTSP